MASANVNVIEKETKRNSIDGDIISNLPSDIIDNIFIRLPIQEAARTSVLSIKWRFKWRSISQLVFHFDSNELFSRISPASPKTIWCLIYKILLLHHGPLRELFLCVTEVLEDPGSLLSHIILLLTGKNIQQLSLYLLPYTEDTMYTLPSTLLRCTHLTHLELIHCIFRLPTEYVGFSKLVIVQFYSVDFTANDFKTFISKCPRLQRLNLVRCKKGSAEIDAPNLKVLLFDCPKMSILFKNVPLLSILKIQSSARLLGGSSNTVNMFASLPAIRGFSAHANFLLDFNAGVVLPERLPAILDHLEYVRLNGLHLNSSKEVQFALLMIRSSPNLRQLQIMLEVHDDNVDDVSIKSLFPVEDSFNQLSKIDMINFKGTVCQLEFVEFLLAKSTALKTITIWLSKEISVEKVVGILKALIEFKRASPEAQIEYVSSIKVEEVYEDA